MARAAWASKAQLLAQLRPFVAPGPASGIAPPELLHDICGRLRGFTPSELRLVLAAYSRHPTDAPALLIDSVAAAEGQAAAEGRRHTGLHFRDVLIDLLVGGSHLGSTSQLLDTAEALAELAPCTSHAAKDFWVLFAQRASRLSFSERLEAGHLARILAACAGWERRCGFGAVMRRARPGSGGAWGHMLRSVGGRLAEPTYLDALSLPDVIAVARHAAQCGEPQYRLAAAVGLRVGWSEEESIGAEDMIDLVGAAGKLGGRLHMMTRALTDRLEPRAPHLPVRSIVRLCSHLGALEIFPERMASALEAVLPAKVSELDCHEQLLLLRAAGRLRWRVPAVLEPLLVGLRAAVQAGSFDGASLGSVAYELYRLDLWDEELIEAACVGLIPEVVRIMPRKRMVNVLLTLAYFSYPARELHRSLSHELVRAQDVPPEALFQLKTVEMAVRVGHAAVSFEDLGQLVSRWLFGIRAAVAVPEPVGDSAFAADVSSVAQGIAWAHSSEVEVGPYVLDFAAVANDAEDDDDAAAAARWNEKQPGRSLVRCCVALEVDGPSHFYRPHGRPWHWTSASKLRHRLLTASGIRVVHVPYYDWAQLDDVTEKEAYLAELLRQAQKTPPPRVRKQLWNPPEGSWKCPACRHINYPDRVACKRCGDPRQSNLLEGIPDQP